MAQLKLVAAFTVVTTAVSSLAVTGCSMHNTGVSVNNKESYETVEVVANASQSKYMSLFVSAIDAIGWVVPMPFSMQGEEIQQSVGTRVSDVAVDSVGGQERYPL